MTRFQLDDGLQVAVIDTVDGFRKAAAQLASGRGPISVDTERASTYRYDDRAFLVQVTRNGCDIFLFAPEGRREALAQHLAPVVNGQSWILHAAAEDLPSLAWLGLYPGTLFDTELAGRLAGFPRPNLAAMVKEFCGVTLEKGHGREDWSVTPLPRAWAEYAALDVLYLNSLATAQAEYLASRGKLHLAEEEFAHIVRNHRDISAPPQRSWRDTKGVAKLRSPRALNAAQRLWEAREEHARATDTAPTALLTNQALVTLAEDPPRTSRDVRKVRGVRRIFDPWPALRQAQKDPPSHHPHPLLKESAHPSNSAWQREFPHSFALLQDIRAELASISEAISIPAENILAPSTVRGVVWRLTNEGGLVTTHRVALALEDSGARQWQIEIAAPVIASHLHRNQPQS